MVSTNYATDGTLGVDVTTVDTIAQFTLGTTVRGNDNSVFVYCQAFGAITDAGYVVLLNEDYTGTDLIETTNSATAFGQNVGVAKAALANDQYGWIQVSGVTSFRGLASAAANAALNTTATAGALDDDATLGAEIINGIVFTTAVGGSAGNAEGILNFPTVGPTIA